MSGGELPDDRTGGEYFISDAVEEHEVYVNARAAFTRTGRRQWIHHHPHGHLCNARCEIVPGIDAGGGLTL